MPLFGGHFEKRLHHRNAGVVHQDIDVQSGQPLRRDQRILHIGRDALHGCTECHALTGDRRQERFVARHENQVVLRSEPTRDRVPDTTRGAGDQGDGTGSGSGCHAGKVRACRGEESHRTSAVDTQSRHNRRRSVTRHPELVTAQYARGPPCSDFFRSSP